MGSSSGRTSSQSSNPSTTTLNICPLPIQYAHIQSSVPETPQLCSTATTAWLCSTAITAWLCSTSTAIPSPTSSSTAERSTSICSTTVCSTSYRSMDRRSTAGEHTPGGP
ncbi:unnamed protein product [Microthlaspi erraticum]|uniref:Uncharacterized protein n=1 Tax=Microthlaspi erraticum TaxID=1685480 RepID=A0A6D2JPQ9_9BRAS|nr:unnamed protein product [Microthlaspi erraticum]